MLETGLRPTYCTVVTLPFNCFARVCIMSGRPKNGNISWWCCVPHNVISVFNRLWSLSLSPARSSPRGGLFLGWCVAKTSPTQWNTVLWLLLWRWRWPSRWRRRRSSVVVSLGFSLALDLVQPAVEAEADEEEKMMRIEIGKEFSSPL